MINHRGKKNSSTTSPTKLQEASIPNQMTENMLSNMSNKIFKLGRRNPKIAISDSTRG
jgi:hypothetical protein